MRSGGCLVFELFKSDPPLRLYYPLSIRSLHTQPPGLAKRVTIWTFTKPHLRAQTQTQAVPRRHLLPPVETFPGCGEWSCSCVHHSVTLAGAAATYTLPSCTGKNQVTKYDDFSIIIYFTFALYLSCRAQKCMSGSIKPLEPGSPLPCSRRRKSWGVSEMGQGSL